ncbi:MAG: hypothetical protein M5T61_02270 [Acidimicrobiia bacterium]|nr:hypothetical protein [Acidimicrobiia bacterium]
MGDPEVSAGGSRESVAYLATAGGLVVMEPSGSVVGQEHDGRAVVAVASHGDNLAVALAEDGVLRREGDGWASLGLAGAHVWTIALGAGGDVYAGTEPAALWLLGASGPRELLGLRAVEGYDKWDSPWGAADLPTIVVDGSRIIVGIEVGGAAVSYDGGDTWEARNAGLYDDVHRIVADGKTLYATTGMGCHRSGDEGRSWVFESDGLDRAYTQGLAFTKGAVLATASSGPPPMWESGGRRRRSSEPTPVTTICAGPSWRRASQATSSARRSPRRATSWSRARLRERSSSAAMPATRSSWRRRACRR